LRGGGGPGGNFGIVVSYEIQMFVPPPNITTFSFTYHNDTRSKAARYLFSIARKSPTAFIPTMFFFQDYLVIKGWFIDTQLPAKQFLLDFVSHTSPTTSTLNTTTVWDASFMAFNSGWNTNVRTEMYGRSGYVNDLNDDQIDILIERGNVMPERDGVDSFVGIFFLGPGVWNVDPQETAFVHRRFVGDLEWGVLWEKAMQDVGKLKEWVDETKDAFERVGLLSGEVYQNLVDLDLEDYESAYYGKNYKRLQEVKREWDPEFYFHFPQSIQP